MTVTAIYQGGVIRPAEPLPLADGTAVEVDVRPSPAPTAAAEDPVLTRLRALHAARGLPPPVVPDPEQARAIMDRIAAMPEESVDDPALTNRDHDRILYGHPGTTR